jgi:hypothetical protein
LDWDSKLRLPPATMPGRKQQRTFAYNDLHRRAPPALERVLLAMVTTSKKGASSFSVNYNMTGETNLPTGINRFLGYQEVYQTQTWDQFREPRERPSSIGRSRSGFRGRERYVPTRGNGSVSDITI